MAQPTPYVPATSFSDHTASQPDVPQDGTDLDAEFQAIKLTTDQVRANLALLQRDDGALANGIVTPESLSDEVYAGISRATPWATATAYRAGDLVWFSSILYATNSAFTSTTNPTVDTSRYTLVLNMTATVPDIITQDAQDAADAALAAQTAAQTAAATVSSLVASVAYLWAGTAGGVPNTLVLTPQPALTAYTPGHKLRFVVASNNTTAVQMDTNNGLGPRTIKKSIGGVLVALAPGDLQAGTIAEIEYISDAAGYQLLNPPSNSQGSDIASSATVNLDAANGDYVTITGTTGITGITLAQGRQRTVAFAGVLTLTHSAGLLLKNNGANITTAAGDTAVFRGEASGVVRMVSYERATGQPIGGVTYASLPSGDFATTAQILSGTASKFVNAVNLAPLFYSTKATQTAGTVVPNNTSTVIAFASEEYDDGDWHDNVTNNSRITVNFTGRVLVCGYIDYNTATNGNCKIEIFKNGSLVQSNIFQGPATIGIKHSISGEFSCSSGDYFELFVLQATGGSITTTATGYLSVRRVK